MKGRGIIKYIFSVLGSGHCGSNDSSQNFRIESGRVSDSTRPDPQNLRVRLDSTQPYFLCAKPRATKSAVVGKRKRPLESGNGSVTQASDLFTRSPIDGVIPVMSDTEANGAVAVDRPAKKPTRTCQVSPSRRPSRLNVHAPLGP